MDMWDLDPLENFIQDFRVNFGSSEELPEKISGSKIFRDENFNIIMHVQSHANDRPKRTEKPLGFVYTLNNCIELKGLIGSGALYGISQFNLNSKLLSINPAIATETKLKIEQITYAVTDSPIEYTIDRIANLPSQYIWPSSSSTTETGETERIFPGNPTITIKTTLPGTQGASRNCARFNFGDHVVIIGLMKSANIPTSKNPGYIYYSGNPEKSTRNKIRASLSFAFGLPLVYFGSCFYQEKGGLVGFEAISPSTIRGRAWEVVSQPFSPITAHHTNLLDTSLVQELGCSFFDHYDSLDLQEFIFRLWHAEVSPSYMKPAYYGAMIESIQKREIGKLDSKVSHTIIEKREYRQAMKVLSLFLEKQKIPSEAKALFLNKIQNGNMAPQRILADRFYSALGLSLGSQELSAWNRRNDAAHGNEQAPGTEIESFRSTKILRVILGRIVSRLINGSAHYIDYYTLTHPVRNLNEAIPEPTE